MKALVFSDLHLQHFDLDYDLDDIPADAEIAIVAGDVKSPVAGAMRWLHRELVGRGLPVIYVAGNHDSYNFAIDETIPDARAAREKYTGVHFLENETVVIDGARFLGCTLWTDFNLYGRPAEAMHTNKLVFNDGKLIFWIDDQRNGGFLIPQETLEFHLESRAWLEGEMAKPFPGKTVVVTHHAPHRKSDLFPGNSLSPTFVSDLSLVIEKYQPDLWVHGHIHQNVDYLVGKTRILCNPRGYVRKTFSDGKTIENPAFQPFLTIDI